ncbi:exonuclease domain-containing protein (plasmid) [Mycolicibacterium aubagnense]|uniref:exonuclease domain-containing protein n=1 Tax=Mycolicibacterium aubagnense TaxID=319707 RepID=UPI0013F5ECB1|nr:exonuclease domain-containing protein [Mycolicibacterium aubagnense]WGI35941.1 exonuclease domain-containing protein [Mycolicibacterium aubagnense]
MTTQPTEPRWTIVDVETTGFEPQTHRVISIAALAIGADGTIEQTMSTLLNPGVDPGPTNIHGITPAMLIGQPTFADIAPALAEILAGRIMVAHNAAFDHAFLAAEAHRAGLRLPVDTVLCTLELATRLPLTINNHRLATLAEHWNITQTRPHDAHDDALVLSRILPRALAAANAHNVPLPLRPSDTLPHPSYGHTAA